MSFKFKEFDIVKIKKIHANMIFLYLKKGKYTLNLQNKKFIKERPAIIIKQIGNIYLVLPLTTKIIKSTQAHNMLRTEFKNKQLNKPGISSYLMFDSLLRLQNQQIIGLYKMGNQTIKLSGGCKKWLKQEAQSKYSDIFN